MRDGRRRIGPVAGQTSPREAGRVTVSAPAGIFQRVMGTSNS